MTATGRNGMVPPGAQASWRQHSPHMTGGEVRAAVSEAECGSADLRRARRAQLAWRPAWSIRSRRGALRALKAWLGAGTET